jgi:phosphoribosylaminoimidazole-succinocarboxamide synthase
VVAADERDQVRGRALVVKRLTPLPIEAVVRGYVIGSGWKDYQDTGAICGIDLPAGLKQAQKLPFPDLHPGQQGRRRRSRREHQLRAGPGPHRRRPRRSPQGHRQEPAPSWWPKPASPPSACTPKPPTIAATRGIIIADTKFEFGIDAAGTLHLIDEALTPDSSRFWPADSTPKASARRATTSSTCATTWKPWTGARSPPAPSCRTTSSPAPAAKYVEAYEKLTGNTL